jgi:hypothetical protein
MPSQHDDWKEKAKEALERFNLWYEDDPKQNEEIARAVLIDEIASSLDSAFKAGEISGAGKSAACYEDAIQTGGLNLEKVSDIIRAARTAYDAIEKGV